MNKWINEQCSVGNQQVRFLADKVMWLHEFEWGIADLYQLAYVYGFFHCNR